MKCDLCKIESHTIFGTEIGNLCPRCVRDKGYFNPIEVYYKNPEKYKLRRDENMNLIVEGR